MQVLLSEWFKVAKPGMPFLVKIDGAEFLLMKINDKEFGSSSYNDSNTYFIKSITNISNIVLLILDRFDKSFTNLPVTIQGGVINSVKKCTCDFRGSSCWDGCHCGAITPYKPTF